MEASIKIENRSQLIYLLTEAAELEHGIMCCYLYTAFTLKGSTEEGVSQEQLRAIRRWRRSIMGIAVEEMLHLGAVCNLLTAVGGTPQLRRPNLPTSPRAYGATFRLGLMPFSLETLEQFIAIEKPIGPRPEGERKYQLPPVVRPELSDIFSSERDYDTQGLLYRGIEDGVKYLAQKYGQTGLFIGPAGAQTDKGHFSLPQFEAVTDLPSALAAIKLIVEQGEGASEATEDSHYSKFMQVWTEYKEALEEDPEFQPARPAVTNPYTIAPTDMTELEGMSLVDDPATVDYCNLFDGCYELMVQMLGRLFAHADESQEEFVRLGQITERLMIDVIDPLGNLLTSLPAGPSHPGMTAGPSFRLSRASNVPPHKEAAWAMFRERMNELVAYCRLLQAKGEPPPALGRVRESLAEQSQALTLGA